MTNNPFITYGYETPEYFCDRKEETRRLISLLTNGNHTALISPRRMGKTGLIQHCFSQPELSDFYYTFLIDVYATKNLQDMVYLLGHAIVHKLKKRGQAAIDLFLQYVTSLRTGISFDGQGNASWHVGVGDIHSPSFTLEEIFHYLQAADKPCIVAIDEFQTITDYPETNIEALVRTYVQQCRNAVFIFSGSQQSMMSEMFSSPSRPFYQSVSLMFLGPVKLSEYEQFARHHFESRGKHIDDDVVRNIYERFDGTTWYIQRILNELFITTDKGETVTIDHIDPAIQLIISQNEEAYKDTLIQLTIRQRDMFIAICKEGKAQKISSANFIHKYQLTSTSSVQKAVGVLMSKQLITQHQGIYEAYDKFFAMWMRQYM